MFKKCKLRQNQNKILNLGMSETNFVRGKLSFNLCAKFIFMTTPLVRSSKLEHTFNQQKLIHFSSKLPILNYIFLFIILQ